MALWGNTDAISVESGGTISINYNTLAVTGAGTSFGVTGFAQVGDILRVGTRVGTGTYFGDAVIVAVASTISCTIGSTIGLLHAGPDAHASTGATTFQVSRLPKYTTSNPAFSEDTDFNKEAPTVKTFYTGIAQTGVAIGGSVFAFNTNDDFFGRRQDNIRDQGIAAGDFIDVGGVDHIISGVGTGAASVTQVQGVGTAFIPLTPSPFPGLTIGDALVVGAGLTTGGLETGTGVLERVVTSITATGVGFAATLSVGITTGDPVVFIAGMSSKFDDGRPTGFVSVGATIASAVTAGDQIAFQRHHGGYQKNVYAVAEGGKESAAGGQYQVDHAGWVGVTTYIDNHGNLRVKKETLVAMSGITTGNVPLYDSNPLA